MRTSDRALNYNNIRASYLSPEICETNAFVEVHEQEVFHDLLILYKTSSRSPKVIEFVSDYGVHGANPDLFWFKKDGFTSFLPSENIIFFGRAIDYGEIEQKKEGSEDA